MTNTTGGLPAGIPSANARKSRNAASPAGAPNGAANSPAAPGRTGATTSKHVSRKSSTAAAASHRFPASRERPAPRTAKTIGGKPVVIGRPAIMFALMVPDRHYPFSSKSQLTQVKCASRKHKFNPARLFYHSSIQPTRKSP
ncbi:MAG TPA: hypothetical protein VEK73_00785 [Xanthobacteraceae bacterium]|nr:hypothetical protein [Xanthobacteraceae bacterium]